MATTSKKRTKNSNKAESDNWYFLKILMYFILGTFWIKYNGYFVLPLGLLAGLLIAQKDRFAIDRKIEYAVLLIAALIGLATAAAALPI